MYYKIAQLNLNPGKSSPTVSDIFIAQPDAYKEELAGKLFILLEIEGKKTDGLKVINFLIDNIAHNFYQNEKISLREKISTLKVEHIFEIALTRTNKHFEEFLQHENIKIEPEKIHITTGVLHNNHLHFANSGRNHLFLIYKSKTKDSTDKKNLNENYKITDITERTDNNPSQGQTAKKKLFSNVVSGEIPPQGHFFATNEALPEYISQKEISRIIANLPPGSAVEQIKNTVSKVNIYVPFLGIIIKSSQNSTEPADADATIRQEGDSISRLNRTEAATEKLLTPSGLVNFKSWLKNLVLMNNTSSRERVPIVSIKDKIFMKRKKSWMIIKLKKILKPIIRLFELILLLLLELPGKIKQSLSQPNNLKAALLKWLGKIKSFLSGLKIQNKIALILVIVFLGLFFFNLSIIKEKKQQTEQKQAYQALTEEIEKKQNNIEANLLYNNEEAAKQLFDEIEGLMAELPRQTEEQKNNYQSFRNKFEEQLAQVQRVTEPKETNVIADFSNISQNVRPEKITSIPGENKIYASDSNQNSLYIVNLSTGETKTITSLDDEMQGMKLPASTEEKIYLVNKSGLALYNPEKENITQLETNLQGEASDYASADTYSNRLYLLNSKEGQIYRYSPIESGLGAPQPWLNDGTELRQAIDISIDGHIYVLNYNGQVLKLLRGQQQDFELAKIDPPLSSPTSLNVSLNNEFIHVLEPKEKRLAVFKKTGEFLLQYRFDQYNELNDFIINETDGIIYLLADNKLIKIQADHLIRD
jgi:hypothetical protein